MLHLQRTYFFTIITVYSKAKSPKNWDGDVSCAPILYTVFALDFCLRTKTLANLVLEWALSVVVDSTCIRQVHYGCGINSALIYWEIFAYASIFGLTPRWHGQATACSRASGLQKYPRASPASKPLLHTPKFALSTCYFYVLSTITLSRQQYYFSLFPAITLPLLCFH